MGPVKMGKALLSSGESWRGSEPAAVLEVIT